ncbi:MAG: hypothetical protein AAF393_05740 [Pseudomonadota bacterium]
MGRLSGNITKLKRKHAAAVKVVTAAGIAYRDGLAEEMRLDGVRVAAYAEQDRQIRRLNGGVNRWRDLSDGREDPTPEESDIITKGILVAMDAAMQAGDDLVDYQTFTLPPLRNAYRNAKQKAKDLLAFINKYIEDKETMKALGGEDYKAWKAAMKAAASGL